MKKILYILSLSLVSCSTGKYAINVAAGTDASEPDKGNFIKMKSGREVKLSDNIDIVSGTPELDRTKNIKIGDKKYKGKDIGSFQLNGDYYSNTAKDVFARRIYRGPINVFQNTSTSTSSSYTPGVGGSGGRWSSSTSASNNYFVQSPKIAKGALTRINYTGRNKNLDPYLKDYKPSMDILAKYRQQRKISRIVKFSAAGLLLASIPVVAAAPEGSVLQTVGAATFTTSLLSIIPISFFYKHRNHARPMEAVQKYIDNVTVPEIPVATKAAPVQADSASQPLATTAPSVNPGTVSDFIELNNNRIIVAEPGTKLKSTNNKIFTINSEKYTSGITAFQLNKKYYRHFPDMKEPADFAQRSVNGKISAFNVVNGSQNSGNIASRNMSIGKKNTYFTKEGVDGFVKKRQDLHAYFMDNPSAFAVYSDYTTHYKRFKTTYFILTGVTVAAFVGTLVAGLTSSTSTPVIALGGVGVAAGVANYVHVSNTVPKLNKEFMDALNTYNNNKPAKKQKKAIARKNK